MWAIIFLNSKSNREGRSSTLYIYSTVQDCKRQQLKTLTNQSLKKIAVFGAGGEIHRHRGTLVPPQEDEGVANHAGNHTTSI
jgi:hypothetical protein